MKVLILDTETGGIETDYSILTATFSAYEMTPESMSRYAHLKLYMKPDDDQYVIHPEALSINRIDLIEHHKKAIKYKDAGTKIYEFIRDNSDNGTKKLLLAGQNVQFDIDHMFNKRLLSKKHWDQFVQRRYIDTMCLGAFAILAGKFRPNQSISLGNMAKALGIEVDESRLHDDEYDVEINAQVLHKFIGFFDVSK